MKRIRNLLARLRRRRRIKAARTDSTSLREFVYLDEVSVYSLLASRHGALATEYTHTETQSVADALRSTVGGSVGALRSEVASRSELTRSQSTQILRKSSIQAAFGELRLGEKNRLAISPPEIDTVLPSVANLQDVDKLTRSVEADGWVVDPAKLSRGDLIEIEVELQSDRIYRYTSIFSAMQSIIQEGRPFFDPSIYVEMKRLESAQRVLTRMLVGLIPVRCRAVDYKVASVNGREIIIHKRILNQLPEPPSELRDLYVVGVTEEGLYWKDVRRVLFSGSRYRVMCRLNHGGIRFSWSPVKLIDVMSDLVPDLALQFEQLELTGIAEGAVNAGGDVEHRLKSALEIFGRSLAQHYNASVDLEALDSAIGEYRFEENDLTDLEVRRGIFDIVVEAVSKNLPESPDRNTVAELRAAAIRESGLSLDGGLSSDTSASSAIDSSKANDPIIDTEIVAIYW